MSTNAHRLCLLCRDMKASGLILPCSHNVCSACLESWCTAAADTPGVWPPECCGKELPWDCIWKRLPVALAKRIYKKKAELDEPRPIYCYHDKSYIPAKNVGSDAATCPKCKRRTCTTCRENKATRHGGECPRLRELRSAARPGEKECEKCGRLHIRTGGCNHMWLVTRIPLL
jgi:hypothetical protein